MHHLSDTSRKILVFRGFYFVDFVSSLTAGMTKYSQDLSEREVSL